MRKLVMICSLALLCGQLWAQSRIISGKVLDEKGNAISGASVQVKGSRRGTTTTSDGVFSISAPADAKTLIISSINFNPKEVSVEDNVAMLINLKPASVSLEEVTVVAYGTQKKAEVTSAISTVNADAIKNQQITTIGQALQGTATGVMVINSNGQPGENPDIRIRGIASISASADPLVVLDGIVFDGNLNMINPNDIESFSILKDAIATSLYGSRGGNGVILVTTKTGKRNGIPSVSLSASYGVSSRAIKDYSYLNTQQQFELGWEALKSTYDGDPSIPDPAQLASDNLIPFAFRYNPYGTVADPVGTDGKLIAGSKLLWNDNWTKALENKNAARKELNVGVSGGTDKSKYYFSAGYLKQESYISNSNFERISTRFNYTTDLTDWFQVGTNVSLVSSKQDYPDQGSFNYQDVIGYGRALSSVFPIYARDDNGALLKDANGKPIFDYGTPNPDRDVNVNRPIFPNTNVVGTIGLDNWNYSRLLTDLNTYGKVNLTRDLYFKSSFGINRSVLDEEDFENRDFGNAASVGGRVYRKEDLTTSYTWNNMLAYSKTFGDHHIEAMASFEAYKYNYEDVNVSKTGFAFSGQQQLSNAATTESADGYTVSSTLNSILGRLKYDYKGKYFAEFTARRDGSSIFAPGYRYGFFPAGGLSWLMSEESFLKNVSVINFLKLRVSYGANGNNALLDGSGARTYFPYLNTYSSGYDDLTNSGVYLTQLANAKIQWEKQISSNLGVDFELLARRLTGSIDVFQKNSQNLILNKPLPPSSGFGSIISNVGKVRNQGVEINLNYGILRGKDFTWDVNVNATWINNKIISLLPGIDTFAAKGVFRNVVGKSLYSFYLPEWAGVDPATGGGLWWIDEKNASGNPTGRRVTTTNHSIAEVNEKWVGSGIPKVTGGFSTRFAYKGIDLSILFNYALGGKYYDENYNGLMQGFYSGYGYQLNSDELGRWQKPGDKTDVPKLNPNNNDEAQNSTRFLFSGNYLRLRNITLGYSLNPYKNQKVVKGMRIYVKADNILTWDKLRRGSDPESDISGYASGNAFIFKTISGGLEVNF